MVIELHPVLHRHEASRSDVKADRDCKTSKDNVQNLFTSRQDFPKHDAGEPAGEPAENEDAGDRPIDQSRDGRQLRQDNQIVGDVDGAIVEDVNRPRQPRYGP